MKTRTTLFLILVSLMALVVGCGKTETPPAQPTTEKASIREEAKAVVAPQPPAPATVTNATSKAPETNVPPAVAAPSPTTLAALSQDQMVQGLQQALGKGLQ